MFSFRDKENRQKAGKQFVAGVKDYFDPNQQTFAAGGRFIPKAEGGIRFTGAQDGLNAVDALVREIEIRFNNQFGTSSSSLFGGR